MGAGLHAPKHAARQAPGTKSGHWRAAHAGSARQMSAAPGQHDRSCRPRPWCPKLGVAVASHLGHWTAGPCRPRAEATGVNPVRRSIVGRETELAAVRRFVGGLADGAASLTLMGEAGIGKTAIWAQALLDAHAAGLSV